jgi:membrane-bound lytic murein transglycosylase B
MQLHFAKRLASLFGLGFVLSLSTSAVGQNQQGFSDYLNDVAVRARAEGVSQTTLNAVLPDLRYSDSIAALDRRFAPTPANAPIPPFAPYKAQHVDATKIRNGRRTYMADIGTLTQIERETGVPASIMVAIFGHETNYGTITGSTDLPNALATLAYEGRRRALFEGELIASLKLIDRGIPRSVLKGSFAGAFGYPQFLPSVYLRLAKDGDGDGRAEIWSSRADSYASIANYFIDAGWRRDIPWGVAVAVPSSLDRLTIANKLPAPRCQRVFERHSQWKTMKEWRALGILPLSGSWPTDDVFASLLEPDGPGGTGYLLTSNYRAILDYNCSNFYAMSVGLLADEIRR